MLQKIIQVGNSAAVTLPKDLLSILSSKIGDFVEVRPYLSKREIIMKIPLKQEYIKEVVDVEVYRIAKNLLQRYLPAFKKLAKK